MQTSDFDYCLPPELIAQAPLPERTQARMMVVRRSEGSWQHRTVADLPEYLVAGDLLVVNNTRVLPVRLFGQRADTGGRVELLLLEPSQPGAESGEPRLSARGLEEPQGPLPESLTGEWVAFYRASRSARAGQQIVLADGLIRGEIMEVTGPGRIRIRLNSERPLLQILERHGFAPLPPYIHRPYPRATHDAAAAPEPSAGSGFSGLNWAQQDREMYQTVFASRPGAVAAPTAGLHFTPALLRQLADKGVQRAEVTLHVGPGTFKPVKTESVEDHVMESEWYAVGAGCADAVARVREQGRRVVAVGTTVVRTLETVAQEQGRVVPASGRTTIFLAPPCAFRVVDALLTNFHLPKSTLLMLVSALAGSDLIRAAYQEAIRERYRFYSYGDCMLIL